MATTPVRPFRRRWLLWLLLSLGALAILFGAIAGFYIDILWFREVGFSSVFWTRFWSRLLLGLLFGGVFFVLLYANLLIVRRLRPRFRQYTPEEETIERYRVAIEPHVRWLTPAVALLLAAFAAVGVASQWEAFQLWRASGTVSFGVVDPLFERDISFYLLSLPFQQFVQSWLFTSLIVISVATAAAHYLWGGIRLRVIGERVTPQVKAHLSVLLGLVVLVRAWGYQLGKYDLLVSDRGTVTGATYTDVNAQLPALTLLVWLAVAVAVLFLVNIRFRGWALPTIGIGILVIASILAGAVVPAIVQRFQVDPQELQREGEFIQHNIDFTRVAYGIDDIDVRAFDAAPEVSPEEAEAHEKATTDIRLWNPDVLKRAYLQLQRDQPYYEFVDVDVDRYDVEGERSLVMISPREIDQNGIPGGGGTWQNRHLFYTHGFGVAASRVDQVTTQGAPAFVLRDIPAQGALAGEVTEPRVYFQELTHVPFVVVGTDAAEFDFPRDDAAGGETLTRYEGMGGIEMSGLFRRLAFAWRYRDVNLLISGLINEDSKILINTDLATRVQKIAPFLQYDRDPYIAIVDGRLTWIWDAYTTANTFPYSQQLDLSTETEGSLEGEANYIRNSVKVTVDAYDGTTTFYVVDDQDPVIRAWSAVFPDLFTSVDGAPAELVEHFRYPEDLFLVQAHQYANYHVTEAAEFYGKEDFWEVPMVVKEPTTAGEQDSVATELEPYYVLLPLPGETEEQFLLFVPFTPAERPNMVAWLAAKGDPEDYGELVSFEFQARNVTGPPQAVALIQNDTEVAEQTTLFGQLGSEVIHGDILAIPVGNSFIYVQPLYLEAQQQQTSIPELKRVVVVNGDRVAIEATLEEALTSALAGEVPPEESPAEPTPPVEPSDEEPTPPPTGNVSELLAEAERHFELAEEALQAGDLATYEREIDEARGLVEQAAQQLQGTGG